MHVAAKDNTGRLLRGAQQQLEQQQPEKAKRDRNTSPARPRPY